MNTYLRHILSISLLFASLVGSSGAWANSVDEAALVASSNSIGPNLITEYETARDAAALPPQVSAARTSSQAFNLGTPSQEPQLKSSGLSRAGGQQRGYMGRVYQPSPNLHQIQVGDELQFEAPQGQAYPTTVTKVSVTEWGNTLIHASTGDVNLFAVVNPSGQFFSSIDTPEGKFQSSINLGETLVVSSADGGIAETPFVDDMNLQRLADEQPDAGASPRLAELTANPTVITVGILVDNTIDEELDVSALVDFLIGVANDSYQNSGLDIRFDVVAVGNYQPYISYEDMSTTLDWITCGSTSCSPTSGTNTVVRNWRDTNKADMVAQLVYWGTNAGTCGMGQLPWDSFNITNRNNLIQYTYSVSGLKIFEQGSCAPIVLAHEMGHNFGLFHDRETLSGQGWTGYPAPVFDYAFGYRVNGVFGTTMSYVPDNDYLLNLSNPNITYDGRSIGVPIGQPTAAFAAQAVGNVMSYYGNIYDPVLVSHTVTASASAGGSISPSGAVNVEEGQSLVFSLTLQQGYLIQGVTGCSGTLASDGLSYTTGAIFSDCSVAAQFSLIVAPSTPQITDIDYGNEEIYLSVSVANNGGSTISSYVATCTDGTTQYTGTSSTSRITVSGLTNGVGYSCSVTATNAAGTSTSSATSPPIVPEYIPTGLPVWLLYEASK